MWHREIIVCNNSVPKCYPTLFLKKKKLIHPWNWKHLPTSLKLSKILHFLDFLLFDKKSFSMVKLSDTPSREDSFFKSWNECEIISKILMTRTNNFKVIIELIKTLPVVISDSRFPASTYLLSQFLHFLHSPSSYLYLLFNSCISYVSTIINILLDSLNWTFQEL